MKSRSFTNRLSLRVPCGTAGVFAIAAAAVGWQTSWITGLCIVIAGAVLAAIMQACRTPLTILCDHTGVTVQAGRRPGHTSVRRFTWREVKRTRYVEGTLSAWDNYSTVEVFSLEGSSGTLLTITSHWHDFAEIVARCNEETPHVPYAWVPTGESASADVLEHAGAYCRVARLTAQYSKLPLLAMEPSAA